MLRNRYRHILWFFARMLLGFAWWDIFLPRLGLRALGRRNRAARMRRAASAFRKEAILLGGVMIKVGQFLSARLDVLPREVTEELSGLQDEVRAEALEPMRRCIESELQSRLEDKFDQFDPVPIASASIGQVYRACLPGTGQAVVIKVQRPAIEEIIRVDLAALSVVGGWLHRYQPIRKRANVPALLVEFSRSLYEEIDYLNEGKNAETFAANFKTNPIVRVPQVIWSHTTRRVLTLENVQGIKISDSAALDAAGIPRPAVAKLLFDTYLQQIFEDRFFHADPHPGNLFVLPRSAADNPVESPAWQLVFVDFGMTGQIAPATLTGLREIMIAAGTQDSARLVRAYQSLEMLLPGVNLELLEKASARVFERFWGKTAPELMSMHQTEAVQFAEEFSELLYEFPFQVPENFILLGRSVSILSGICTGLDTNFNVWTGVAPYARKLVEADNGGFQWILKELGEGARSLLMLPRRADALLTRLEQGRLETRTPDLNIRLTRLEAAVSGLNRTLIFLAFFTGGVIIYTKDQLIPAAVLGVLALAALLWPVRRGRFG
jgi:predicted unusual protein kinase regulating ubiquinone biosynthesis (AarF/ABC1/UbiB family)